MEQIEDMKNKHCMTEKKYKKNSFIFRAGDIVHEIGIVLEGSINIEMIDMWDNKSILSNIDVGQIFAESYALCNEPMMVDAVATKDSTILMLNMRQIFAPINNNASWYNTFTYNLLVLSTKKNLTLSTRIFCTSSKSVRGRVLTYLSNQSIKHNNTEFKIQQNINKYFNNQTIICIAHRLSTLKDMDNILVIEKGEIVDFGTPDYIIPKYDKKEFLVEDI